jgi:hypothetical protein
MGTQPTDGPKNKKLIVQIYEVDTWLRWAGEKLLCMPVSKPGPTIPTACWPTSDLEQSGSNLKSNPPGGHEIKFIDDILDLVLLVPDPTVRRILHARALVAPVSGKHLYSWVRLAKLLKTNRKRIATLHNTGLLTIAYSIEPEQAKRIANFMAGSYVA